MPLPTASLTALLTAVHCNLLASPWLDGSGYGKSLPGAAHAIAQSSPQGIGWAALGCDLLSNLPGGGRSLILFSVKTSIFSQLPLLKFPTMALLGVILVLLGIAYAIGSFLQRQPESSMNPALVQSFNHRIRAWWMLYALMGATLLTGSSTVLAILFFFGISFWALREFITLTPTRLGDHRALFWVFYVFAPLQYIIVWLGHETIQTPIDGLKLDPYQLFFQFIPVYGFLFIPARVALAGDPRRFLERTAKIQAGLFVCVYALSHAPALLSLKLVARDGKTWQGGNGGVLVFFILVVQMSDIFQFIWNHVIGRRVIASSINASKTWEGLIGGTLTAMLVGMALCWVTPFSWIEAAGMAFLLSIMGFAGTLTMSAIKRDRGVQDYGTLVEGHVGVLDRFDSICFAAPVFFHATRFLFT